MFALSVTHRDGITRRGRESAPGPFQKNSTANYTYDDNGNILYISDGTNTTLYAYDSANQLIRENNQAANKTWVWTYDDGGNITSRTEYPYSTGGLGTATSTVNYTYDTSWGDLLTGYNGQTISSDTIGNMLSDGTWTYTWEHGRELATMSNGTTTWTYTYNADGMRTSRSNGTATYSYIYNGSSLSQMTVGNDTLYFAYGSSTPMSVTYNGTTYYYVTNLQGDIVAILDSAGTAVVTYAYDAWGNILSTAGSMADTLGAHNPLRYRGYVYDQETGLYYLQSRYYNPELGRFINADAYASTGQGFIGNNMFAYCNNNPVCNCDNAGMRSIEFEETLEGGSVTMKDSYPTAVGTLTVVVVIDITVLDSSTVLLEDYQLTISTTEIEIVTPYLQTMTFNYDSTGIQPGTASYKIINGNIASISAAASTDGWGVQYNHQIENVEYTIQIMYKPSFLTKTIERISNSFSSSMSGLSAGVPSWSGSGQYASLLYASSCGCDKLGGTMFMFR